MSSYKGMTRSLGCQREVGADCAGERRWLFWARMAGPVQLHLVLPYKLEVRQDRRVQGYLDRGYRIVELQRVSDREVVVTLTDED